jgi:molybdenum cofactor cytidylyltransferase
MGAPKALLHAEGSTFLDRVTDALQEGGCAPVIVVVADLDGPVADRARAAGARVEVNTQPADGPITSLRVALRTLRDDVEACAFLPVDHPLVKAATVARLIASLEASEAPIVVPSYAGERGHPVLFRRSVFPELFEDGLAEGARTVVHRHLRSLSEVAVLDKGVLADIDTPEEYLRQFDEITPALGSS